MCAAGTRRAAVVDKGTILEGLYMYSTRKMDPWKNVVWDHVELEAKVNSCHHRMENTNYRKC